jgi:hypothetical protein
LLTIFCSNAFPEHFLISDMFLSVSKQTMELLVSDRPCPLAETTSREMATKWLNHSPCRLAHSDEIFDLIRQSAARVQQANEATNVLEDDTKQNLSQQCVHHRHREQPCILHEQPNTSRLASGLCLLSQNVVEDRGVRNDVQFVLNICENLLGDRYTL